MSFFVTRGADGQLLGAIILVPLVGGIYVLFSDRRAYGIADSILHLVVFEGCAITGIVVDAQLQEMGGMLYLFDPILVLMSDLPTIAIRAFRPD